MAWASYVRPFPAAVVGIGHRLVAMSAAHHNLVVLDDGAVLAWGWNFGGRLGDGTTEDRSAPVTVLNPGSGVVAVAAGNLVSTALRADGAVLAWGSGGSVGDGTRISRSTPGPVPRLRGPVRAVSSGGIHTLAVMQDGSVVAWGDKGAVYGEETAKARLRPAAIPGLESAVVAVQATGGGGLALREDGAVLQWPDRLAPQEIASHGPTVVPGLESGVRGIAAGPSHFLALLDDASVVAWGFNFDLQVSGQLASAEHHVARPVRVDGIWGTPVAIAAGSSHSLILLASGEVVGWGSDEQGQLGGGGTVETDPFGRELRCARVPVRVDGFGGRIMAIAAGTDHNLAVREDGALLSWGSNLFGQLGDGAPRPGLKPLARSFAAPNPRFSGAVLTRRLAERGLGHHARDLIRNALPSIRLRARPATRADRAVGGTRLGGAPDLPVGMRWPRFLDEPLSFVAQVDCAQTAPFDTERLLPQTGVLSFFVAPDLRPGWDADDRGAGRVLYFSTDSVLRRRDVPDAAADRFDMVGITLEDELTHPPPGSDAVDALGLDRAALNAYEEALGEPDQFIHRMFGHPDVVQEESMPLMCQMASNGVDLYGSDWRTDPAQAALASGARDWVLLLQLDEEDAAGMEWGDCGRLYYWIRRQDLAERRFDRIWLIYQCH